MMKRVAIVGPPGTGKSTFAEKLGEITGLPVIHLDIEFSNNKHKFNDDRHIWQQKATEKYANADKWVIDGNVGASVQKRLERADTIVYLNFPTTLALKGVVERQLKSKKHGQPHNFFDKFDPEFLSRVAKWNSTFGKDMGILLEKNRDKQIIVLKNRRQVNKWLSDYKKKRLG